MYTVNMSRTGILVAWRGEGPALPVPHLGQIVTVEIELPAHHGFGQKCIHAQGTVVRVAQQEPECPEVALSVNYMDFRAFQDRIQTIESLQPSASSWMA